ncbi:DNA polymerase III, epsilon subunit [Syntrophobotulus glycolicus DSM 8271]|uniref:DNA polymerase III, epsilon subunit n=1 Tax=Syntrophobotulus glycolicus (strain DSM 8271 / FlGlyR) TaxID=645991 RepID=F0STU5_SYNGF|nr:exonuclease domain-containing protein [Syntrophobotulus glycolicus]ADY55385.1 DNA polymerase III, epsilon subunit [Syntrophobotulus glycolicus DSM 8271]
MPEYAVLDLETTGLFPEKHDRIIEVAIIILNSKGEIADQYETLVNPDRDLGPTHIHKISAGMVSEAPKFKDIAGDIIHCLAGKHIIGHNIAYDYRFIKHEFRRLKVEIPEPQMSCTFHLTRKVEPDLPCRKLEALCSYFDIPLEHKHAAYFDCYATAVLFQTLLKKHGIKILEEKEIQEHILWPALPVNQIQYRRQQYENREKKNYISGLIERLPNFSCGEEGFLEYLNLLDDILTDRKITELETEALFHFAEVKKLSKQTVISFHHTYLTNLVRIALLDGILTDIELQDLRNVACILDIDQEELNQMIITGKTNTSTREFYKKDCKGKSVCFTGTLQTMKEGRPLTREEAHALALEYGLIIKSGVTKDLDFLVAADSDSMSGKAKKARQYNVNIMAEQAFWNMLGVQFS